MATSTARSTTRGRARSTTRSPAAFTAIFGDVLAHARPERAVEAVNASGVSYAMHRLNLVLDELVAYEPDLVIVYSGHNEFYGVYGAASLQGAGESTWSKKLYYSAMQWRLSALLRGLLAKQDQREGPPPSLLKLMAKAGRVGADDPRRSRAETNLRDNIADMAALCREAGVPLPTDTAAAAHLFGRQEATV